MQASIAPGIGALIAGRYRVSEELGRGGHGVVFRATQLPLGREVALKMVLPEALLSSGSVERFLREAALAQQLEHPNTVRMFDFGQSEEGLPFIVWELLRGRTLHDEIARAPLNALRTHRVASQILKSLMEAHARGIVHRDIKPANVFLANHAGESDFVKVLDFGVARPMVSGPGPGGHPLTHEGQMIGTPTYMAPEQIAGGDIVPATDLYALGLVMAEALSGFCIMSDTSPIKVWMRQASPEPVPLPPAVTHSVLGAVIEKATQKPPYARYASAAEMLADLDRVMMTASNAATDPFAKPLEYRLPSQLPTTPLSGAGAALGATPPRGAIQTPLHEAPPSPHAPTMGSHTTPLQPAPYATPLQPAPYATPLQPAPYATPLQPAPYATPLQPAPYAVAAPTARSSPWALIAASIAALTILVGVGGVAAFLLYSGRAPMAGPTLPATTPSTVQAGALKGVTPARTVTRIKAAGWALTNVDENHAVPGYGVTTMSVARPPEGGTVQIYDYESISTASMTEDALRSRPNSAVVRDGGKVVFVAVFGDQVTARELLDAIVR